MKRKKVEFTKEENDKMLVTYERPWFETKSLQHSRVRLTWEDGRSDWRRQKLNLLAQDTFSKESLREWYDDIIGSSGSDDGMLYGILEETIV